MVPWLQFFWDEEPNDYDLYAKEQGQIATIANLLETSNKALIIPTDTGQKYSAMNNALVITTGNAITLANRIQFIKLGTLEEQRKNFDFIHCMPYYDISKGLLYISEQQWHSLKYKKLILNEKMDGREPRYDKFLAKGWQKYE